VEEREDLVEGAMVVKMVVLVVLAGVVVGVVEDTWRAIHNQCSLFHDRRD